MSTRAFGSKAYLSWIFGCLVVIAFLGCGTALRGTQSSVGKCWAALTAILLFSSVFGISRGESAALLKDYTTKVLLVYFFCCAFAISLRNCRTLINGNILCTTAVLVTAVLFGAADEGGRFRIPDSFFLGNSNDLALTLVCGLGFSLLLIWQRSAFARILGYLEFLAALFFLLKTGSRGGFLALVACMAVWLVYAKYRGRLLALAVPALALLVVLPGSTLSRLVAIATPGGSAAVEVEGDISAQQARESQEERTLVFQKSIKIALHHPLLGTGPGTFMDALWDDDVANGTHTHAIGTHNTYTQIASECGFPALFVYLGVLFGSLASNLRIMKLTRNVPAAEGVFTMSLCLFGSLVAFAVGSTFDHVAYSLTLPVLSGISVALALASRNGDPAWIASQVAAGNA